MSLFQYLYERHDRFARTADFRAFFEQLDARELERLEGLWAAVIAAEAGDLPRAAAEAEALVRGMPDADDEHGAETVRTFGEAILGRLRRQSRSGGNLYLDARPPGAQLRAFELLRLRTPLIPFGYAAANKALIDLMEGAPEATLIDIGIGRAGQIRSLLRNPLARRRLRALHVVGVEPDSSAQGGGALQMAEEQVRRAGAETGVETTFHPIAKRAEELSPSDLVGAGLRGLVVANASLSLHHTLGDEGDFGAGRERVLMVLHAIGAAGLVLVEPDTNHHIDDFQTRFLYAYRHYRSVSSSLRSELGASDARLVWQEFFAPEVRNVLCHDGSERTERHEETGAWVERLRAHRWLPEELEELLPQAAAPEGFTVRSQGAAFSLRYRNVSLLSVIRARRA